MKSLYAWASALLIPVSLLSVETALAGQPHNLTDQIIVRFDDNWANGRPKAPGLSRIIGQDLIYVRETSLGSTVYKLPSRESLPQVKGYAKALMATSGVQYAAADEMMFAIDTLQDPPSEGKWVSDGSPVYDSQWHYHGSAGMDAPGAWAQLDSADTPVRVAVIDTGYTAHSDLVANLVDGVDMVHDPYISNDGDGRDTDASDPGDWTPSNYCYLGSRSSDSSWHGTHVAGTIAAVTNNSKGVAGVGYNLIQVVPVRGLGQCGGYGSDIADGIRWAAGYDIPGLPTIDKPVQVINMSLGGGGACAPDSEYQLAINDAVAANTTVVVAAGNSNADAANYSPASCANVISVAATGPSGDRAYYSNYGESVDLAAPGGDMSSDNTAGVLSTLNAGTKTPAGESYAYYQGTSMATPHAAAVAALLYIKNPSITPAEVEAVLKASARTIPGTCNLCGDGLLSAGNALTLAAGGTVEPEPVPPMAPTNAFAFADAGIVTLSWFDESDNETGFRVERSQQNRKNKWSGYSTVGEVTSSSFTDTGLDGIYQYRVQSYNAAGASAWAYSNDVTVSNTSSGGDSGGGSSTCKGNGPKCR
ncbi:S8 family serine peptidase [Marinobacterium sp. YM272]|uniref:S8 family serine peptidase n=1 Tax=Marinobacterium sp. YM272 TaxID=3421654 RepID=UPI003D7F6496